jgi:hypothetical protein
MELSHDVSPPCFTAQLQKAQKENEHLRKENRKDTTNQQMARIPRPPGAASNWKLQQAMQLTGSVEMSEMYAGIQVCAHIQ